MYKIYSHSPQYANFGECESLKIAMDSVEHYQESCQCLSGRIVVSIDTNPIVVARFNNNNWSFDRDNMALYEQFLEKERTKKIQINSYFQRYMNFYHRVRTSLRIRLNRVFK